MPARLAILSLLAIGAGQDDLRKDAANLQGEWRCVSMSQDGKKIPLSVASKMRLTLDGKLFRQHAREKELLKLEYQLRPDGIVRFDIPGEKGAYFLGRYELKGDSLRACFPGPIDGDRPQPPAGFEAKEGVAVSSWERVKDQ